MEQILKFNPCKEAKEWLKTQTDIESAYQNCVRGDWLHWIKYKTADAATDAYAADAAATDAAATDATADSDAADADAYAYANANDAIADAYANANDAAALSAIKLKQANQIREKYPTFQSWIDSIGKKRFRHW